MGECRSRDAWRAVQASLSTPVRGVSRHRSLRFETLEDRHLLATITVTSLDDNLTVNGQVTLREAIRAAELDISVDGSQAGAGADVIEFHTSLEGVIHLSSIGSSLGGASALSVSTPIAIRGNANGITIARSIVAPEMRLFHVTATGNLTIESLMLAAGVARGADGDSSDSNGKDGRGGAILNDGALLVVGSTLYGNASYGGAPSIGGIAGAGRGGAIFNANSAEIHNSTISGNASRNSDGTQANQAFGGGVFSNNGFLEIDFCTIVDNNATAGRGVYVLAAGEGKTSILELDHSIVGNNGPMEEATDLVVTYDLGGISSSSGSHNLVRREVGFDGLVVSSAAPQLGLLGDNGGPTWTHAILPGSPAIDAGSDAVVPGQGGVPAFDQRGTGFARSEDGDGHLGTRVDIGAFELPSESSSVALPGDYSLNGIVDAADYTIWRSQLNHSVAAFTGADGDGNGLVNMDDYQIWRSNFGASSTALVAVASRDVAVSSSLVETRREGAVRDATFAGWQHTLARSRTVSASNVGSFVDNPIALSPDNADSSELLNLLARAMLHSDEQPSFPSGSAEVCLPPMELSLTMQLIDSSELWDPTVD